MRTTVSLDDTLVKQRRQRSRGNATADIGPAVIFGLGGIFAEVLKDVSFRLAPVTPRVAREMIAEIRGYPLLVGARGRAPEASMRWLTRS